MKKIKNKRVKQRKNCLVPVEGKRGTTFADSQTVDISEGGMGLISSRAIPLDEKIAVEIATAPDAEPIVVMGKVVWVRKMAAEDRYRVGLKFQKTVISGARQKFNRLITL